jgi:5-oxoprolinase (ATP-hydrolysing)
VDDWQHPIYDAARTTLDSPECAPMAATEARQTPEVVELELFTHRFAALAREMGERLRRTAVSTNVKERMDFSCALLDPEGRLVVNAPHIPVHLGALGLCVRRVREAVAMAPGDVVVTNHPAYGGSHLPDVTVITPVFEGQGATPSGSGSAALLGYVASRAHHAELGGRRPGSMPPDATCLAEEGVVIPPTHLVRGGEPRWTQVRALLSGGPFPTRALAHNLADLDAAVSANHHGARALRALAAAHGRGRVRHFMDALRQRAAERLSLALARQPAGERRARQRLDDGSPLQVRVAAEGGRAAVDFTGSAGVHPGNLNAPPAVVRSAVLYALRVLLDEELPLNEGLLEPVDLVVPPGMLDPPFPEDPWRAPAVVGGNVETSQRLVDLLLEALGLAACSQGTMNNLLFGDETFGYYETVCGGSGAGPGFSGARAVHVHTANTRITDPEVLEHRFPVRLERFAIRRGSGGAGRFGGGDGAVRELTFLAPVSLSLLSQRRAEGPCGLAGGRPGLPGRQWLVRADGATEELAGICGAEVAPGDRLVLETPGGGGWGEPEPAP